MNTNTTHHPNAQKQRRYHHAEQAALPTSDTLTEAKSGGRLRGRVALVAATDAKVSNLMALGIAREGAHVVILCAKDCGHAPQIRASIEALGGQCIIIAGNLADEGFCSKALETVLQTFGHVDIFINDDAEEVASGKATVNCLEKVFRKHSARHATEAGHANAV